MPVERSRVTGIAKQNGTQAACFVSYGHYRDRMVHHALQRNAPLPHPRNIRLCVFTAIDGKRAKALPDVYPRLLHAAERLNDRFHPPGIDQHLFLLRCVGGIIVLETKSPPCRLRPLCLNCVGRGRV